MSRLFQTVPEEDLDIAVLKNDLVLSQAQTKRVMDYAKKIASNRTGMPVRLRSYDAITRAVEKACDRSIDTGVMRNETYTVPESIKPVKGVPKVVDFKWQDVIHSAVELLTDTHLSTHPAGYLWEPVVGEGGGYGELNTGDWWKTVHENTRTGDWTEGPLIVPIILAADGSSQDFRGNLSIKPINLSVGNFTGEVLRTDSAKRCVAYWPDFRVTKKSIAASRLKREFYQWVLGNITSNIAEYPDGLILKVF